MSIAPPSDIVLDVAQAADPRRVQAATTKLNALAASSGGGPADFAALLDGVAGASPPRPAGVKDAATAPYPAPGSAVQPPMSPYRKFEAVLLQTLMQEMLPKDEHLFGDAASGDMVRSMLAEQLAGQLAKSGRIGIAALIEKAHPAAPAASAALTPADPAA